MLHGQFPSTLQTTIRGRICDYFFTTNETWQALSKFFPFSEQFLRFHLNQTEKQRNKNAKNEAIMIMGK